MGFIVHFKSKKVKNMSLYPSRRSNVIDYGNITPPIIFHIICILFIEYLVIDGF